MTLIDVLNAPWAIEPSRLMEIQAIYAAHARGERVDLATLEARLGRPLANEEKRYEVVDGVAVLPIDGVIAKRMNLFSAISGGVSSQLLGRDLREAVADKGVHSIVLAIDSPGGTVDGTEALANIVREARGQKPIVALADGIMASAAYWIGSAAQAVYIADVTTQVGSIGVVAKHVDVSGLEAQRGLKTTEISAGKYKRSASQYGPLTDEGRGTIQAQVDYVYSLFVEAVAKNRGVSEEKVLQDMADGRLFTGQQAVAAGLVDGLTTLDALIAQLNREDAVTRNGRGARRPASSFPSIKPAATGASTMQTKDQILAESPEAAAELIAQGAEQERARIQGVEGALMPGHEALIAAMKFDGKTAPGDAALVVLAAERKRLGVSAQALADDAPAPVKTAAALAVEAVVEDKPKTKAEQAAAAATLAAKDGISFVAAFKKLGFDSRAAA